MSENPEETPPAIIVRVEIIDPANYDRARQAATRLVQAVARELQRLESVNPDSSISILGRTYNIGMVLADLRNTDFVVTDQTNFKNEGRGAATRGVLGERNVDVLNMDLILVEYDSTLWPGDIGITVMIFHEMAHISQIGTNFFNESVSFWESEPRNLRGDFYPSPYSDNIESFANDFKDIVHNHLGIPQGPDPGNSLPAQEPSGIHQARMDAWS